MTDYKVGAYIRISKEDTNKKFESESIKNQRELIKEYIKNNSLILKKEYIDDGYTGTNFNRPGFINLINDIEKKKINMVITKDLSRLGRNYIQSGYYIEDYFPMKKVRFISILDRVDTIKDDNDIAPFKALFNDMVSKDTSKKIKSILISKKKQGLFLGSKAPYGYTKFNKYYFKINKKEAQVVKKVFNLYLNKTSINNIVTILNNLRIKSPNQKNWSYSSVYNILHNPTYKGVLIQNKWTNISYKNKKKIKKNKSEWIIIYGHHEPIIEKEIFDKISKKNITTNQRHLLKLEGKVFCKECHCKLGVNYSKKRNNYFLICNNYKRSTNCTPHYTNYLKLEKYISENYEINKIKKIYIDKEKNIMVL